MGGAGWADPLPAMRAALRECGIRLTHKRVAGDGNCFLHALACAAGTTARERIAGAAAVVGVSRDRCLLSYIYLIIY